MTPEDYARELAQALGLEPDLAPEPAEFTAILRRYVDTANRKPPAKVGDPIPGLPAPTKKVGS